MKNECLFCSIKTEKKIADGEFVFVIEDDFPVTKFHSLIIPKRHVASYFDLTEQEMLEINKLLKKRKEQILAKDKSVAGFNVGINVGADAGQSIFHVHVHLIPRRRRDVAEPRGGVRGVIPHKRNY